MQHREVLEAAAFTAFKMAGEIAEQISIFLSLLKQRRFGDGTLRILESILVSRDVASLLAIRSSLKEFMRYEAFNILSEFAEKSIDEKLFILGFFVSAFALVADAESCLALKYEALVLREHTCTDNHPLQVSYDEWLKFAEDSLENGFYSIAVKGYENALTCLQSTNVLKPKLGRSFVSTEVENIKKVRDATRALVASQSVQAQTADYLTRKSIQPALNTSSLSKDTEIPATSIFRSGIRKRNTMKLHQIQSLQLNS